MTVYSQARCALGEGPLWHPLREQLFWFDIIAKRLLTIEDGVEKSWTFDEHVSAAGWLDNDRLLVASEVALFELNIITGATRHVVALEADNPATRSNDGRADPWGGFWIGTMGKAAEPGQGAIYRLYQGALRVVVPQVTISNAICFAPDRSTAYYADTRDQKIMALPLDAEGWPSGEARVFVDLTAEDLNPDGAVVDAEGCLWCAQWGASRVACYGPDGQFRRAVTFPASQISCPAFGGEGLKTLFATSAAVGLPDEAAAGQTFRADAGATGLAEYQVIL
ncbi:SMP-30/gluconolactonase/LRE family protein [Alphaproteobacteria bacterium KMM 3653]|uniref:SMP-30/gluconolactonase/LRE family protein n=1 Tax=Harenicola maris TaxID=2841044 RepID=A0AAP2G8S5_9RHOB|nr:SMP-30/gluconolactonase/LRE family protein [Harenicola maris]